ncbi:MAG: toxic anion resistance protein [Anaeroplasmataceae bacterium]|nr:toxic anion resistance protein [Anaeroplasmataceae bacterium]
MSYENLSVMDIEKYGSDVQEGISSEMKELIKRAKCVDLGNTNTYLQELSDVTNKVTGKNKLLQILPVGVKQWVTRYESVESKLNTLGEAVVYEREKLNSVLGALMESKTRLNSRTAQLTECETYLRGYLEYLDANPSVDEDGLKRQACVNRLKVVVTTNAVVRQEMVKTVLIIKENKEIVQQLTEASDNLLPMFNVMMLNTLASKANSEAIKMRKAMIATANKLVIENVKQIEKNADELISGRSDSLIDVKTIEDANRILQNTIKKVIESAKSEEGNNMMLVESIKSSIVTLDEVKKIEN